MSDSGPAVTLVRTPRDRRGLEPADAVAGALLADFNTLWNRACMILAICRSSQHYQAVKASGWPGPFATDRDGTALGVLESKLDELYRPADPHLIDKRRARVLELVAARRVSDKYTDPVNHHHESGDVDVLINGRRLRHGLLDVCFWASCCFHGEFYDCKSGYQSSEMLSGTVSMLSQLYNTLMTPDARPRTRVGIISFADDNSVAEQVRNCRERSGVEVFGEVGFATKLPLIRVCTCLTRREAPASG